MRIRIVKDTKMHKKNEIIEVNRKVGFDLINSGVGVLSKELLESDMRVK